VTKTAPFYTSDKIVQQLRSDRTFLLSSCIGMEQLKLETNGSIDHFGETKNGSTNLSTNRYFFKWSEMIFRGDVHNHLYQMFQETKQFLERICNLGWRVLVTILENVFKTCKTENNRNVTSCFAQTLLPDKTGSDATRA